MKDMSMTSFLAIGATTLVLILMIGAIQLTVLIFRNPFRASWLRTNGAETLASVSMVAGFSFATGFEIASLVVAGVNPFLAIAATAALCLGVATFNWRKFRCGERLRRADAGQSPFAQPAAAAIVQHGGARPAT